jgi:hypothetical protein
MCMVREIKLVVAYFKTTEDNDGNVKTRYPICWKVLELGMSRLRNRCANHSTATYIYL